MLKESCLNYETLLGKDDDCDYKDEDDVCS